MTKKQFTERKPWLLKGCFRWKEESAFDANQLNIKKERAIAKSTIQKDPTSPESRQGLTRKQVTDEEGKMDVSLFSRSLYLPGSNTKLATPFMVRPRL